MTENISSVTHTVLTTLRDAGLLKPSDALSSKSQTDTSLTPDLLSKLSHLSNEPLRLEKSDAVKALLQQIQLAQPVLTLLKEKVGQTATLYIQNPALPLEIELSEQQINEISQYLKSAAIKTLLTINTPATQTSFQNQASVPSYDPENLLAKHLVTPVNHPLTSSTLKNPVFLMQALWIETQKNLFFLSSKAQPSHTMMKAFIQAHEVFSIYETASPQTKSIFSPKAETVLIQKAVLEKLASQKEMPLLMAILDHFSQKKISEKNQPIQAIVQSFLSQLPKAIDTKKNMPLFIEVFKNILFPQSSTSNANPMKILQALVSALETLEKTTLQTASSPLAQKQGPHPIQLPTFTLPPPLLSLDFIRPQQRKEIGEQNISESEWLEQMLTETKGALSRQSLHQIASLTSQKNEELPNQIFCEIPIIAPDGKSDLFHLKIQWEQTTPEKKQDTEKHLSIKAFLAFDLHDLGKMYIEFMLVMDKFNGKIWAEKESTLIEAKKHLPFLEKSLQSAGFSVEKVICEKGAPPKNTNTSYQSILDIHA